MKYLFRVLCSFLVFAFVATNVFACANTTPIVPCHDVSTQTTQHDPRMSFVKIETHVDILDCSSGECVSFFTEMMESSGFIIESDSESSHIVTTGHSCDAYLYDQDMLEFYMVEAVSTLEIVQYEDGEFKRYDQVEVLSIDSNLDACVVRVDGLTDKPALSFAYDKPAYGDQVINYSNAVGSYAGDAVLIMKGIYSGDLKSETGDDVFRDGMDFESISMFSLSSAGGASGSPILNMNGEVVGMIHSVSWGLSELAYSAEFHALKAYVFSVMETHSS